MTVTLRLYRLFLTLLAMTIALPVPSWADADEIVKAHAPKAELDLFKAYAAYEKDIEAPNDIVRDEIAKKQSFAWQAAVLKIGTFHNWTATIKQIESGGRIVLRFSTYLNIFEDVAEGTKLFSTIRTLSDREQPVYISGRLIETSLAGLGDNTDLAAPTCFEEGVSVGCQAEITDIRPIQ